MDHHRTLAAGLLSATIALSGLAATTTTAHAADSKRERYDVSIVIRHHVLEVGDRAKIRGLVFPDAPGQRVELQVRYAGQHTWKTVDRARLTRTSFYKFKERVDTVRARTYRVVKPAAGRHDARAVSHKEEVTVFGWRDLASLDPVGSTGMFEADTAMAAVAYPRSVVEVLTGGATHSVDYDLDRSCTRLVGTAGVSDSSQLGGTSTVAIAADGISRYSQTFALTQTAPVAVDLTGVSRVTVSSTSANGGLGALGTPQVYCSF